MAAVALWHLAKANSATDTMETYFDSRLDLLQRNLAKHSDRLKLKADKAISEMFKKELVNRIKTSSGEIVADDLGREMKKFKLKVRALYALFGFRRAHRSLVQVTQRMTSLSASWQSAKIIRTREKLAFMFGVLSLVATTLIYAIYPQ